LQSISPCGAVSIRAVARSYTAYRAWSSVIRVRLCVVSCRRPLAGGNQQLLFSIAAFDCCDIPFMLDHECKLLRCILTLSGGDRCAVAIFVTHFFRGGYGWCGSTGYHSTVPLVSNASANALFPRVFWGCQLLPVGRTMDLSLSVSRVRDHNAPMPRG